MPAGRRNPRRSRLRAASRAGIRAPCRRSTRDRPARSTRPVPPPARRHGRFAPRQAAPWSARVAAWPGCTARRGGTGARSGKRARPLRFRRPPCSGPRRRRAPATRRRRGRPWRRPGPPQAAEGGTDRRTARDAGDHGGHLRGRSVFQLSCRAIDQRSPEPSLTSPAFRRPYGVGYSAQVGQRGYTRGPRPFVLVEGGWRVVERDRRACLATDLVPRDRPSGGTPWRRRPPRRRRW